MYFKYWLGCVALSACLPIAVVADDDVFSGPQIGETLPPLVVKTVLGDGDGKELDVVKQADGKPLLVIVFHARTRPAFGLMKAITQFAATKTDAGLKSYVVFLTDDPSETVKWTEMIQKQLPVGVTYAISPDGIEGPGAYGLNRNVTLTVLVGNNGKVTENLALIQPQLQADGPKILKAIVDVTGGGDVPSIDELAPERYAAREQMDTPAKRGRVDDSKLSSLVRSVINRQADDEQVKTAAAEVEAYVQDNEIARKELGRIATTVVNSGKIANYGTEAAQAVIRGWVKKYGEPKRDEENDE